MDWPHNAIIARKIFARLGASRRRRPNPKLAWSDDWEKLLEQCDLANAEKRGEALDAASLLERRGMLHLKRFKGRLRRIEIPVESEPKWFAAHGQPHPRDLRDDVIAVTRLAAARKHATHATEWNTWCRKLISGMESGSFPEFVDRQAPVAWGEDLNLLFDLTSAIWPSGTLIRTASAELCADSKALDIRRARLQRMLRDFSDGRLTTLLDVGLADPPRRCRMRGPVRLRSQGTWLDLGLLRSPFELGEEDIADAEAVETSSGRVLTVENETTFTQLAKLQLDEVLVHTSYAGSGTLAFLRRLPDSLEYWHFGDSDPKGFDILRDLRERSGRPFRSLHMRFRPRANAPVLSRRLRLFTERLAASPLLEMEKAELEAMLLARNKGDFEQERLGRPSPAWPHY